MKFREHLIIVLAFIAYHSQHANAQVDHCEHHTHFEFLPAGLHFSPLKANHQEARVGVFKYFGTANLKIDIGNTIDLLGFSCSASDIRATAGIDFMAYAYITGAQGLRLQVDALDGFFGGNLSFSRQYESSRLLTRLRILHLSAHMVDGHYSISLGRWIDNREPIPFTKDFGELTIAHEIQFDRNHLKYYGGVSYATLVRPGDLKRFGLFAGFEFAAPEMFGILFGRPVVPFAANHFSLAGTPQYAGNNQLQAGVKFGTWEGKGIVLYLAYYAGNSFFSEYYQDRVSIVGAGFTAEFP